MGNSAPKPENRPPAEMVGVWLSDASLDISAGYGVHRAKRGYFIVKVKNVSAGGGSGGAVKWPAVKITIKANGWTSYIKKEESGKCNVYDTWAKEWNGEGCVLGMGVGQLDLKHNEGSNTLMHGGRHVVLIPVHSGTGFKIQQTSVMTLLSSTTIQR
eukprot:gene25716-12271_t